MWRGLLLSLALALAGVSAGCARPSLTVSAASSLAEAFRALAADFESRGGVRVDLNLAGSGALEAQVRAGAPVGVFASAGAREPEALFADGLVEAPVEFARNRLVVAVRDDGAQPGSLAELAALARVAVGAPATVPSGRYAAQSLRAAGIELGARSVPCENVRQALAYLERGEVDAAFVYRTDLRAARRARVAFEIPDSLHEPIRYLACVVRGAGPGVAPAAFVRFLLAEEGQAILREHGFEPPEAAP